jgi:transposase-like protein
MRPSTVMRMARARRANEPSTYQHQPEISPTLRKRFDLIRAVIGERTTISEAARQLDIARVNMQTLVHRAEAAIATTLQPRSTGPAPKPPVQKQLEVRVAQLEKENAKLKKQLQAADDMMMAAGEIIRSLRGLPPATSRTSSSRSKRSPQKPPSSDEEPERAPTEAVLRRALERLTRKSRDDTRIANLLGIGVRTLRRWLSRLAAGKPLIQRRGGVMLAGPTESEQRVRETVRELHGLAGAASLARTVSGVSRRRAAQLKHEELTSMERTRKEACARVEILKPGVVRGLDAMYLHSGFALNVADACVPYRTSLAHVPAYDADYVAAVLDQDFRTHGAPLVLRDDCARCHTAPVVMSVLDEHRVALLQGPTYYAQYYGQLERQNGEQRRWLARIAHTTDDMQVELDRMKTALNERWLRPTLSWRSAAQCWAARGTLDDVRDSFLDDVHERAARLRAKGIEDRLAMRLAIEQALTMKGYLRVTPGRKALCE